MRIRSGVLLLLSGWLAGGCDVGAGEMLSLEEMGTLASLAFIDLNGNGEFDAADLPAPGLDQVLLRSNGDTAALARSDASGVAIFPGLPIGSYTISIATQALGDTLSLAATSRQVRVPPRDTARSTVGVRYPRLNLEQARVAPAGKIVSVEGVAQYNANLFGDSTLVIADNSAALRISGITSKTVQFGDSIVAIGRIGSYQGQPALLLAALFNVGVGAPMAPVLLTSAEAASARSGTLDGRTVHVSGARVLELSQTPTGDSRLKVDDGSGVVEVFLDRDTQIQLDDPLLPGVRLDVTGTLAPRSGSKEWRIQPRGRADIQISIPHVTIAEARSLLIGQFVSIEAVALNNYSTYSNGDVYLTDPSGSIRAALGRSVFLFVGDRVRVLGFVGARNGEPVLLNATAAVLGKSEAPAPQLLRSGAAAAANSGGADAALVRIERATIREVQHLSGTSYLTVDDGSGPLIIAIEAGVGVGTGIFKENGVLDATGVLEPASGGGVWQLKPRSPSDLVLHP